jgi:hypothetical protein
MQFFWNGPYADLIPGALETVAELQSRLRRAYDRMWRAGAHYVVDTIADVLPAIDQIGARLAS